jgi:GT2 family glycosyltransferase
LETKTATVLDDITVVIPTLGRPILQACLYYLAAANAWPGEILVVDQSASDAVAGWTEGLRARGLLATYVPSDQRGRATGINRGLERVRTRFVTITDDDCFVAADWLERMAAHLRHNPRYIVTGRVEPAGEGMEFATVRSLVPKAYYQPLLRVNNPLIGGNMGTAMANVERIGPFDEHPALMAAEDSDWGYRALRRGVPILYIPEIVVYHYSWRTAGQVADRYMVYARSHGAFYGKHLPGGDPLIFLQAARDLVRGPLRWLRGSLKRNPAMAASGKADTVALLPGILAGLRRRQA